MRGKLIVVEGTDCSGKETQTNLLLESLKKDGMDVVKFSFPFYDTPTGKIIGGPYLGKSYICDGWFSEGATNVDPKVASLYYAADRLYNMPKITELLDKGVNVILDRYVYSNLAHQGGKIKDSKERSAMYDWLEKLEFDLLKLPDADIKIFLYMPLDYSIMLGKGRKEALDQHEQDESHLKSAMEAYLEIAERHNFKTINCVDKNLRTREDISAELINYVKNEIKTN